MSKKIARIQAPLYHSPARLPADEKQTGLRNGSTLTLKKEMDKRRLRRLRLGLDGQSSPLQSPRAARLQLLERSRAPDSGPRKLNTTELTRHTGLAELGTSVRSETLALVLAGLNTAPGHASFSSRPQQGGRIGAMRHFLRLQSALSALEADDDDLFFTRMAPVNDFDGDLNDLSRRFYQASQDDAELEELLSGFALEPDELENTMAAVRSCGFDDNVRGYQKDAFREVLRKAMRMEGLSVAPDRRSELRAEVQEALHELSNRDSVSRDQINATLNTADEAAQAPAPNDVFDDYITIAHSQAPWADKCVKLLERYCKENRPYTTNDLIDTLNTVRRAAGLDLDADTPSTDKGRLSAIIESHKLIVRLKGTCASIESTTAFIQRKLARQIAPADLLHGILNLIVTTYVPANDCIRMVERLGMRTPQEKILLLQACVSDVREMPVDIFADDSTRETLIGALRDAIDMVIEEEEMLDQEVQFVDAKGVPVLIAPAADTAQRRDTEEK